MKTGLHKLENTFQTVLILILMAGLFALPGYILAGIEGIIWFASAGVFFIAGMSNLGSNIILRSMNIRRFDPVTESILLDIIEPVASKAGIAVLPRIYMIPSNGMNALSLGDRGKPVIALTAGLVSRLSKREIQAVLAHEVAHIRAGDLLIMRLADMFRILTDFFSLAAQIILLIIALLMVFTGKTIGPLTILTLLVLAAAPGLSFLLQTALSRVREYEADLYSAKLTGDPLALASALQSIEEYTVPVWQILWFPIRKKTKNGLLRSHPSTNRRIDRLANLARAEFKDIFRH